MISVANAFGRDTQTHYTIRYLIEGAYDDDNKYVGGFYTPEVVVKGTPLPNTRFYGENSSSTLHNDDYGERVVSSMSFSSKFQHPMNSLLNFNGTVYKVTNEGDFSRGGYWTALGREDTSTGEKTRLSEDWSEVPADFIIRRGKKELNLRDMMARRELCK